MRFKSPEDFLNEFLLVFPSHKKLFKNAMPSIIDLALIHSRACEFTAEEIFFGAILAALKIVPINLTDSDFEDLLCLTDKWESSQVVCQMIEEQTQITDEAI